MRTAKIEALHCLIENKIYIVVNQSLYSLDQIPFKNRI